MKLTQAEKSTLILAFAEVIPTISIHHYGLVLFSNAPAWEAKTLAALGDEPAAKLTKQLDESGLIGFFRTEILYQLLLSENPLPTEDETTRALVNYEQFSNAINVATALVERLRELPRQYRMVSRAAETLSNLFGAQGIDLKITDQLRLVSGSVLAGNFTTEHKNARLHAHLARNVDDGLNEVEEDKLYFEYRSSGLVTDSFGSQLGKDFGDVLRAFYGACISADILMDLSWVFDGDLKPIITVNEIRDGEPSLTHLENVDADLVKCANLVISVASDKKAKGGSNLEEILEPAIAMLRSDEVAKLTTAAIWLLRAHFSSRGMDKILNATIAIEVLLGDRETSDRIGLGKLMGNRCAYSLARTASDRKGITDFFSKFYKVRSEIVHSGRFKISKEEEEVVTRGLSLASQILVHEIRLAK